MRILFDGRSVRTPAGLQVFQGLTGEWARDRRVEEVIAAVRSDFDEALVPAGVRIARLKRMSWIRHLWVQIPALANDLRAGVIFCPNGLAPRDPRVVVYFQDVLHFRAAPFARTPSVRRLTRRLWQSLALGGCRLAVCVSHDVYQEASTRFGLPAVMIPNGVEVGDWRWTGCERAVFVMGGAGARKAEATAIAAWRRLAPGTRRGSTLVIAGVEPARRQTQLRALASDLGIGGEVCVRGAIEHAQYLQRIAGARIAVSCSTTEAFGLPVAEALAMGAPVICSDIPSHAELVARAGAGELFAAGDDADLAARLALALRDCRPAPVTPPREAWSWQARARDHLDAYERCHLGVQS